MSDTCACSKWAEDTYGVVGPCPWHGGGSAGAEPRVPCTCCRMNGKPMLHRFGGASAGADPTCEIREPHEHGGVRSTGPCWRNPMYSDDREGPRTSYARRFLDLVASVEWQPGNPYLLEEWLARIEAEARAQGGPSLDVGRWKEAWRAHQRKVRGNGWMEPCTPGCTQDILDHYARLGVAPEPSE